MNRCLAAFVGLLFWFTAQSQELPDTVREKSEDLETLLENATLDATDSQLADILAELEENPLDLNSASEFDLQQIPGITAVLASRIVSLREKNRFESVSDLFRIEGMTEKIFARARTFVTVFRMPENRGRPSVFQFRLRSRALSDLNERAGFANGSYEGSLLKSYNRAVLRYSDGRPLSMTSNYGAEVGILTEKDPGEGALTDFVAGYSLVNIPSLSSRLILGDFVVEAAEGLVLWRSVGFSKGSEVISPLQKRGSGIKPYLSTDENLFLRGAALEWSFERITLSFFHSNKPVTASINSDGNITSVFSDGYHRTPGELSRRNNSREQLTGFRAAWAAVGKLKLGGTMFRSRLSHGLLLNEASGYQGNDVTVGGVDFAYVDRNISISSEFARTQTSKPAGVVCIVLVPDNRFELAIVVRDYPRTFANIHAFGFRESGSLTQNEYGTYLGAKLNFTKSVNLSAYYDQFRFPWRTSSLQLPAAGNDFLLLSEINLSRFVDLQALYKNRNKPASFAELDLFDRSHNLIVERNQKNYRITLRFSSSSKAEWKSRIERVDVQYSLPGGINQGYLWLQDMRLRPWRGLTVDGRVIIFDTDSFDSRVYEFENDLRGTFSNPALFGKGIRWYILVRHRLGGSLEFSAKYSKTVKDGVKSLSSGLSQIAGDSESQFSFQIDLSL